MQNILVQIRGLFGLLVVAFIIQVIAFATPWWSVLTIGNTEIKSGLWQGCEGDRCVELPVVGGTFLAIRGLTSCGLIFGLAALILAIRTVNSVRNNAPIPSNLVCFPIFSMVAGACTLIGCAVYGSSLNSANGVSPLYHAQLHISFGAAILAAGLQVILGITGLVLRQRHFNADAPPACSFTQFDVPPTQSFAQFDAPPAQSLTQFRMPPTQSFAQFGTPPTNSFTQMGEPPKHSFT